MIISYDYFKRCFQCYVSWIYLQDLHNIKDLNKTIVELGMKNAKWTIDDVALDLPFKTENPYHDGDALWILKNNSLKTMGKN